MPRRKEVGTKYFLTRERAPIYTLKDGKAVVDKKALSEMARILGALGGAATKGISSSKKKRSSRKNGKLGGRPKGSKNKPKA